MATEKTSQKTSIESMWELSLRKVEEQINPNIFKTWFSGVYVLKISESEITVGVPNDFVKNWIQQKYSSMLLRAIQEQNNSIRSIRFVVSRRSGVKSVRVIRTEHNPKQNRIAFDGVSVDKSRNLNQKYTFRSFVVAPYNELGKTAAQTVVKKLGMVYNPLFIYGNTGVGKTHLIQAIGNKVAVLYPNLKIYYTTSEQFANHFYSSLQNNKINEFKEYYRALDVLIMDDIQFIDETKQKTMEQLFHLFNALYDNNKQIIFSADKHPSEIAGLEDRLKSRFSSGMIIDIPNPDKESRVILLNEKAKEMGVSLGDSKEVQEEIVKYIVENIDGGVREIEGIVKTISIHSEVYKRPISLGVIKKIIHVNLKTKTVNYKDVIKKVCAFYEVDSELVVKRTRKREVVLTRQVIMYLLRECLDYPYSSIGLKLGGKDHTTVIHSCDKIKKQLEENVMLKNDVEKIKRMLSL